MGDRANVLVKENKENSGIYLYTHWEGTSLPQKVQEALAKKWRWDDVHYLTRIIFDCMTRDCQGEETGFGISPQVGDGANRIIEVITSEEIVIISSKSWTFEEYIKLPEEVFKTIWR